MSNIMNNRQLWEYGFIPVWEYNRRIKHSSVKRWSMLTDLDCINMTSGRIVDTNGGQVYNPLRDNEESKAWINGKHI